MQIIGAATQQLGFWIAFGLVVIVMPSLGLSLFVISDRKRQSRLANLRKEFIWDGMCSRTIDIELGGNKAELTELLTHGLAVVGDGEVTALNSDTLIAWTPFNFMVPALQQQLACHFESQSGDGYVVRCCSRPRFGFTPVDYGRSEQLVLKLVAQVS